MKRRTPFLFNKAGAATSHAFDALVTRYRGKIYGLIFNLVRNEADAWDLSQDVFFKAWKALPKFQGQSAFFTWLYRIAHNVALDWMRARKVEGGVEFDDAVAQQIESGAATAPREEGSPDERLSALGIRPADQCRARRTFTRASGGHPFA